MAFQFGTTAAAPTTAAGAAGAGAVPTAAGFSFGGTTTTPTATPGATATTAPLPGFSFGTSTTAASAAPPPAAPPSVSLFGGAGTAAAAVPPSSSSTALVVAGAAPANTGGAGPSPTVIAPDFDTTFPNLATSRKTERIMTVKELQHELRHRRLSTCGIKTVLQERLQMAVDRKVPYYTEAQLEEAITKKKKETPKKKRKVSNVACQIENTLVVAAVTAAVVINAATATLTATPTTTGEKHTGTATGKKRADKIRACVECHKAKKKCVIEENATRCRRCMQLNTECIPHHSKQGVRPRKRRRKEKPPTNTSTSSTTEKTPTVPSPLTTSTTTEAAVPEGTKITNRTVAVGETPAAASTNATSSTGRPSRRSSKKAINESEYDEDSGTTDEGINDHDDPDYADSDTNQKRIAGLPTVISEPNQSLATHVASPVFVINAATATLATAAKHSGTGTAALDAAAATAAAVINAATATLTTAAATPTTTTTSPTTTVVTTLKDVLLTADANTDAKVEAEASKREAKNIRACVECHKAKVKYIVDDNATRCRRCTRLNTECIPYHSKQGQGPRKRRRKEKLPTKSRTEETQMSSTTTEAVPEGTGIPSRTVAVGETPAAASAVAATTTTTTMPPASSSKVIVADLSSFSTTEVTAIEATGTTRNEATKMSPSAVPARKRGHTPEEKRGPLNKKTISKTLIIDSTECAATGTVPITTTTDSVVPKNLSEILGKNVSTFPTGFAATISSEIYDAMFREIFVEYQLCDQATEERPILHQRLGKGRDGSGCSYITIDWGHIKEVVRALGPDGAPGCQQFIKHFYRCFLDQNRESGCTVSIGRRCQIRLYDGGATSSRHNDATRNMINRYMSSLCVDPNEVRGLNLFANYYVDGVPKTTTDIVGEYTIQSGSSIMISALAAGNAQGWGSEFPPITFSSTEYGDETFLKHQSTPCKGRNMCIIIDFDECNETVYKSFLEKNCNRTTFEKGLELRADVEQALTKEFQRPRSNIVRLALSEAISKYWSTIPFDLNARLHSRNRWKNSGQLRQPYQCAKCGTQYQGENFDYLQNQENCKHITTCLFTSAQLLLVELPGNTPTTVKEDSESKKNLEQRTQERRQRFIINKGNFHRLPKHFQKYKRPIDKLQKNKIERQVQYEISEMQREKEELQRRIQDKNNKGWIKTPLPDEVFDNVDMDGKVSYTMGPYKYNLEWYDFQKKCDQDQSYKYPPFATDYEKNWKPRKEGYLIRKRKRDDELSKKYGTKVIRTTD